MTKKYSENQVWECVHYGEACQMAAEARAEITNEMALYGYELEIPAYAQAPAEPACYDEFWAVFDFISARDGLTIDPAFEYAAADDPDEAFARLVKNVMGDLSEAEADAIIAELAEADAKAAERGVVDMGEQGQVRFKGIACTDLPTDELGDADIDRAEYIHKYFDSAGAAARWAIDNDIWGEGSVEVESKYFVPEFGIWQWGTDEYLSSSEVLERLGIDED